MSQELTEQFLATIRSAAQKLTGYLRRQFQAETTQRYCNGSPRQAERLFGWGRAAVQTGLHELRTGIRCLEDYSTRGRRKTEEQFPDLAAQIHLLLEPESQADPKFQTPLAFTRLTAKAVRGQLAARTAETDLPLPAERSLGRILNRLGYRLRRVCKTKPQKNFLLPTPSSTICGKSTRKLRAMRKHSASRSIPRPK